MVYMYTCVRERNAGGVVCAGLQLWAHIRGERNMIIQVMALVSCLGHRVGVCVHSGRCVWGARCFDWRHVRSEPGVSAKLHFGNK